MGVKLQRTRRSFQGELELVPFNLESRARFHSRAKPSLLDILELFLNDSNFRQEDIKDKRRRNERGARQGSKPVQKEEDTSYYVGRETVL